MEGEVVGVGHTRSLPDRMLAGDVSSSVRVPVWRARADLSLKVATSQEKGHKHASAVGLGGTPESVITLAMERAVQKYGPQDWLMWEFRAEPIPKTAGAEIVRFVWHEGVLVRW